MYSWQEEPIEQPSAEEEKRRPREAKMHRDGSYHWKNCSGTWSQGHMKRSPTQPGVPDWKVAVALKMMDLCYVQSRDRRRLRGKLLASHIRRRPTDSSELPARCRCRKSAPAKNSEEVSLSRGNEEKMEGAKMTNHKRRSTTL